MEISFLEQLVNALIRDGVLKPAPIIRRLPATSIDEYMDRLKAEASVAAAAAESAVASLESSESEVLRSQFEMAVATIEVINTYFQLASLEDEEARTQRSSDKVSKLSQLLKQAEIIKAKIVASKSSDEVDLLIKELDELSELAAKD